MFIVPSMQRRESVDKVTLRTAQMFIVPSMQRRASVDKVTLRTAQMFIVTSSNITSSFDAWTSAQIGNCTQIRRVLYRQECSIINVKYTINYENNTII
jgi:hypothetical protein